MIDEEGICSKNEDGRSYSFKADRETQSLIWTSTSARAQGGSQRCVLSVGMPHVGSRATSNVLSEMGTGSIVKVKRM